MRWTLGGRESGRELPSCSAVTSNKNNYHRSLSGVSGTELLSFTAVAQTRSDDGYFYCSFSRDSEREKER
jgi:hypothetical protein